MGPRRDTWRGDAHPDASRHDGKARATSAQDMRLREAARRLARWLRDRTRVRAQLPLVASVAFLLAGVLARPAAASPGVEGTRNLSMGAARSSSFGTNAVLINPSNMPFSPVFTVEPLYQLHLPSRTHGIGAIVMDSLINPRISVGLGYLFMRGTPRVTFMTMSGDERRLELQRFGHEALAAISVTVVKQWLSLALKPKYQYTSLRYRDDVGLARNAHDKLSAFGLDTALTVHFSGWAALSLMGNNVTGNHAAPYTDERELELLDVGAMPGTIDPGELPELSDYPLTFEHGLAVFPLHHADFSINFDGLYDFTTYRFEDYNRTVLGGSAEYVVGPVPLRFGTIWDGRGRGGGDDKVFVSGGIGFIRPAKPGGIGVDAGFGFRQGVRGDDKDTFLGFNIGLRIHPD